MDGNEPQSRGSDLADAMSALLAHEAKRTGRPVGAPVEAGPPPAAAGAGGQGGKEELLAAWDSLVDHEANKGPATPPAPPSVWRRALLPTIALASTVAALYLTISRPAWLYPVAVSAPRALTDSAAEHYAITAAMLTEEFFEEFGRLPAGPDELGLQAGGVALVDRGDGFYQVRVRGPSQTFIIEGSVRGSR